MSCFIIAEAGVNHNGSFELARDLIYAAKDAGADAVKFQTFKADSLVTKTAEKAQYQKANEGSATQHAMLKALELSEEAHRKLAQLAAQLQIEFMSTAFDEDSLDFLVSLGVKRLKIPSGEVTNLPYLEHLAKTGLPLILSTGMCTLSEVEAAVNTIRPFYGQRLADNLTLLHCTSNYPAAFKDINLKAMCTLAQAFKLPVGYSDHSLGVLVPTLAVGLGAKVLEKHFTLDKTLPGPDHAASMTPAEFKNMVQLVRDTELILGNGDKKPVLDELPIRELVRRSITLRQNVSKGAKIAKEDLILLRPGTGISPACMSEVIGRSAKEHLKAGSTLLWDHLEHET